jgi:hypothetical protein
VSGTGEHILMVWQETPPAQWPDGYTGACVKATDGKALNSRTGFSLAANYAHWRDLYGDRRIGVWSVAYPQDGVTLGADIAHVAPHTPYVVLDVEDFSGVRWNVKALRAVVAGVRSHLPRAKVGYSTYPTRAQAQAHGVNQHLLDSLCDFAAPQVYYPYQRDRIHVIDNDHRHASWIVAPADDEHWDGSAKASLARTGRVFYWRCGVQGWRDWARKVAGELPAPHPPGPAADPLRPDAPPKTYPGRFVAYDGHGWWLTDMVDRVPVTEEMARSLHGHGVPVERWDMVARLPAETDTAD